MTTTLSTPRTATDARPMAILADDPTWYKDAIIYELHVRAFADSNGDGIGDFRGLVDKLDYLQDLGVTALWLLPFYPSPLRDDGYDIADYTSIHASYGTMRDFRRFIQEAHDRGLRVITELVINHTSTEHPWFQRARQAPAGSRHRNYYVWSDTPERYRETRIIFQDTETSNWAWDPVAHAYYWHRFFSHQPDLNFESPDVQAGVLRALDFWMDLGVDGLRLDAIPYLYEREGTNCENLPETHVFLKKLRAHVDANYKNRMLLAEANQWPEDAAAYFGAGDECHMNFHFPLMPRMFMAVQQENNFPILDILEQTPAIPDNCQWALFLRNHDELTLEMVTDVDRDYMYRSYAEDPQARINVGIRRRLAPLMKTRRKIELLNGLLMSLPGTPVLYYGDEIGMGDNIYLGDRNGVRTPMQWSADRNAGFSRANPQKLYLPAIIDPEYHYESLNVEAQENNPSSLLWWMKRLIALRKRYHVFGRGTVEFLRPDNAKVLAFIRKYGDDSVLVVANLSRFAQSVELDLRAHDGLFPREMFGRTRFPRIGSHPYLLTLGPHGFYWLSLEAPRQAAGGPRAIPVLSNDWEAAVALPQFPAWASLIEFLGEARWFRGKARDIRGVEVTDRIPVDTEAGPVHVLLLTVDYVDDPTETYVLPLAFASGSFADQLLDQRRQLVVARVGDGIVYDAMAQPAFATALLQLLGRRKQVAGDDSQLVTAPSKRFKALRGEGELEPRITPHDQSNTTIAFGDRLVLKLFRQLAEGENPDVEIGRFLTEERPFSHVPALAGVIDHRQGNQVFSLAVVQQYIAHQSDAWSLTRDSIVRAFERTAALELPEVPTDALLDRAVRPVPQEVADFLGDYSLLARQLGERTAQLHRALDGYTGDPAFRPEEFSTLYQRSLYQTARTSMVVAFDLLARSQRSGPDGHGDLAREVLGQRRALDDRLKQIIGARIEATRIRCHGDYHLGQVLFTGNDFVIIDFEGEPSRSIGERRIKQSPLRDVAGMIRSFHYAAVSALRRGPLRADDLPRLAPWGDLWHEWVSAIFLHAYLETARGSTFLPENPDQIATLLDFYLVEKCAYELAYELQTRPDWVEIPLYGLRYLL